ncbi:MAG: hypothetical protein QOH93_1243 [Chloroflexia bacterium]|jgi:hypothetical protein|nr:hypothetical protein [Chloroflexia bacterium]
MPQNPSKTFSNARLIPFYPGVPHPQQAVRLKPSTVFEQGRLVGEIGTTGVFSPYDADNEDGTEIPKGIVDRPCATDAQGEITYGAAATGGPSGETHLTVPAYFGGAFKTTDLVGLDENAATVLGGHLISGSIADGIYSF